MANIRLGTKSQTHGGLVTGGTIVGLLMAIGITLFGLPAADSALVNIDASAWMWSTNKGEVARVNGVTGRVDTRYKITDSQGHAVQMTQTDRYVVLRDLTTGKVSVIDLAALRIGATTQTTAGLGVTTAIHGDAAFVIDSVQGVVSQLDPATLLPRGQPLHFPPGLAGGAFDDAGRLWVLVPSEGTVVAIAPTATGSSRPTASGGGAGGAASDPRVVKTFAIAEPSHDLAISVLDSGVAVLDKTALTLTTLRGDVKHTIALALSGPGTLPDRTVGATVPVTVVDQRHVYVITGDKVAEFTVPGDSPRLRACVAWSGRFYCADEATGSIYVLDSQGRLADTITIPNFGGVLELEVRENRLFINAPNSSSARVVDDHGRVKVVDKYANDVLGGDPPPNPPPPPPKAPTVGPPGPPANVVASAGNSQARVTWGSAAPNGAPLLKYVVEGDGKTHEVGAGQHSLDLTGLTNGQSYTFSVYAVNAKGAGPKRTANPVVPTSDVPDAPTAVSATANPDGTVTVTWPAANGQGHPVVRYDVMAISTGAQDPVGQAATNTLVIPAGRLTYGTQYAFTVVAINDRGANSKVSPVSNTVLPYTKPGLPQGVRALTVDARGAVSVSWLPAAGNGRPVDRYTVTAGAATTTVPTAGTPTDPSGRYTAQLSGFADGANVTATVVAVNAAGPGPGASATARTLAPPTLTLTANPAPGYRTVTVNFSVNANGGSTTCAIAVNGGGPTGTGCAGATIAAVPGTAYNYTVTVTNRAGSTSASGSQSTPTMYGTVICPNNVNSYCNTGIWAYRTPTQSGTPASPSLPVSTRFVAVCKTSGGNVDARPWGAKNSTWWVRINHGGTAYFPWAWTSLDAGDNLGNLPDC